MRTTENGSSQNEEPFLILIRASINIFNLPDPQAFFD
jgi:hypothetical protein